MPAQTARIPLLRDSHTHPLLYARFMGGIDLLSVHTRPDAIQEIRRTPPDSSDWLLAFGWNSGRYPLSSDDFADRSPVIVFNLSLHGIVVNETGRQRLASEDPEVAVHLNDQRWIERNLNRILGALCRGVTPDQLRAFFRWLLGEHGVYRADEMLLMHADEPALFAAAGLLDGTRLWASPELFQQLSPDVQEQVHGLKLFMDGALGVRTAALSRPYLDEARSGMLMYTSAELRETLQGCLASGKALAIHAIGDRALDFLIHSLESCHPFEKGRVRLEHAQFISTSTARRAKELGVVLCMQPNFSDDSRHYLDRLPRGFAERNNPLRMLIDEIGFIPGMDLVFGSDGMPHGFREGLRQALFPPHPQQRLTLEEFVGGYCLEDMSAGWIDLSIDHDTGQVEGVVNVETPQACGGWGRHTSVGRNC